MLSNAALLFDVDALTIVLAGTLLATFARCGWRESGAAVRAAVRLVSSPFDAGSNRAALARTAQAINERGFLRAETPPPPDRALAGLIDKVLAAGSAKSLQSTARAQRALRDTARFEAQRVFESAGELAPVFGLVGTLFSITQLVPTAGLSTAETAMASVASAVLSSLYGVLLAHFAYLPLARAIERQGQHEERERAAALEWFVNALTGTYHGRQTTLRGVA
ncbi:MAG: MotA/TolQ/ExbB proton channel family protein [Erythrobacter sp.]